MKRILIFSLAYVPYAGGAELAIKEITDRLDPDEFAVPAWPLAAHLPLRQKTPGGRENREHHRPPHRVRRRGREGFGPRASAVLPSCEIPVPVHVVFQGAFSPSADEIRPDLGDDGESSRIRGSIFFCFAKASQNRQTRTILSGASGWHATCARTVSASNYNIALAFV